MCCANQSRSSFLVISWNTATWVAVPQAAAEKNITTSYQNVDIQIF